MSGLFSETWLAERLLLFIPVLLSLTVHEWAHAFAADRLGDDTARLQGRLTLDPLAHIDPVGTLVLPLLGVPFGWARPVPVNPLRFRVDERFGVMLTAAAGPLSNLVLAALCGAAWAALSGLSGPAALTRLLGTTAFVNVALAVTNLLPIPPLDGSRVAEWLMPASLRPLWDRVHAFAPYLLAFLVGVPAVLGVFGLAVAMALESLVRMWVTL